MRLSLSIVAVIVSSCAGPWLVPGVDGNLGVNAPQPFYYGHPSTPFVVQVSNLGDTAAVAPIKVLLQLSSGMGFVDTPSADWSCAAAGPGVICEYPNVLPAGGQLPELVVNLSTGPIELVKDLIRICAELRVDADVNLANNQTCQPYLPLVPTANYDLQITKALWTASSPDDDVVSYLITVTNLGPDSAIDPILVTDTLPAGLTINGYGGGLGVSCSTPTPSSLECSIPPLATSGASATRTIVVQVAIDPATTGTVTNCAAVSAAQDFVLTNNEGCVSFVRGVPDPFDLEVTATVNSVPSPGQTGAYHFFVHNNGPNSTTQQLQVVLDAPPPQATLSYVSGIDGSLATPTNVAGCTPVPGTTKISCPVSVLLAPGDTRLIWMSFWMSPGATGTAPACLSVAPLGDTNAANNEACVSLPATPITAGYQYTAKLSGPVTAPIDSVGSLKVAFANAGAETGASPALLFFTLPPSVDYVGVANTRAFDCGVTRAESGAQLVTCLHDGDVAAGARLSFELAVYYRALGDMTLCAEVAPKVAGVDPLQTQSCATVTVEAPPP